MKIMPQPLQDLHFEGKSLLSSLKDGYIAVVPAQWFIITAERVSLAAALALALPSFPVTATLAGAVISVPALALAYGSRLVYCGVVRAIVALSAKAIAAFAVGAGFTLAGGALIQNYAKIPLDILGYPVAESLAPVLVKSLGGNPNRMSTFSIVDVSKVRSGRR